MWIVKTDPYEGLLPYEPLWGKGVGAYLKKPGDRNCIAIMTFADATRFNSPDEAENAAFLACLDLPCLLGHLHVVTTEEANREYDEAMAAWMKEKGVRSDGSGSLYIAS